MSQIIIPRTDSEIGGATVQTVNARILHDEFGVKKHFSDWTDTPTSCRCWRRR